MYETFEHTADIGLRMEARDLNTLFAEAGRGFFSLIVANPSSIRRVIPLSFQLKSSELDYLLFDWLSELLYTFDTQAVLLADFQVEIVGCQLQATGIGEKVDRSRHQLEREVKAVTYHQLSVQKQNDKWLAEVILDI